MENNKTITQAICNIQIENSKTKVSEWVFPKNSQTGFHTHAYKYIIVPMTYGYLKEELRDGSFSYFLLKESESYYRTHGKHHNIINENNFIFKFIEIEFLN